MCVSTFLGEISDAEDSCKASISEMLQGEVVKNRELQQVQQLMTEGPVYEVDEVYDKIEDRRKKAVAANLGADKVKQHDVGCHEESSDTGSEEVNSESDVAKDSHNVMKDTKSTDEKSIRRRNERGNSDVTVMTAGR